MELADETKHLRTVLEIQLQEFIAHDLWNVIQPVLWTTNMSRFELDRVGARTVNL